MADHGQKRHSPPLEPPSDANRPRPDPDQIHQPLDDEQVSGTDIVGDETNVRTREGIDRPGIIDKVPPPDKQKPPEGG